MIKIQKTKTLITKTNNNSSNCIAPNIIYGCFGGCVDTYCYMSRYNGKRVFVNKNVDEIYQSVVDWEKTFIKEPDQQDPIYTMVLLKLDVNHFNKPPRIRVSLMPQKYSNILEPKMQKIMSRIADVNRLKKLGWEVHLNYSPLVFYPGWKEEYNDLFSLVKEHTGENKCEVIALTNHVKQMIKASPDARELMKRSYEIKNHSGVMRYPLEHKGRLLREFKEIYSKYFSLNTIRYIF